MWKGSSGFCVISCSSSRKASFTSELKMHWCSFLSWEDIVKGFMSARHLLSALGGIRWWKSCYAQGLWTPATRSLGWNSGWTNWIWEQHCGLLCPTHTFASWKKASRGISLSIKWLEEKCLKLPNAVRGSVHIYADLKRCSWADGQTLPFIHPQLPSVTLVTSVWACLASCPISVLESPWRAKPAYDRCCHFHSGCGMLDGLAHLWPRVHYSTERGPKSQDPRNSRRKLIPPISWLHGGEESMGKAQKQSIILPFCKLSCPIFEGTHEQGMVRRRDKGEKGPVSLKLYLDSP